MVPDVCASSRRADTHRFARASAVATPRPNSVAMSDASNGPWVRAHRRTSWSTASTTRSCEAATPGGTGMPRPSRSRAASSTTAQRSVPPTLTSQTRRGITARTSARIASGPLPRIPSEAAVAIEDPEAAGVAGVADGSIRRATSSGVNGPRARSMSTTCSAERACRPEASHCREATISSTTAGSSSRPSPRWPSTAASRAGSTDKAAARSAESPS